MKIAIVLIMLGLSTILMYNNCGKVGDSGLASNGSETTEGDPVAGGIVYNSAAGSEPSCFTCHGANGMQYLGVDLKTYSAAQIETAVRIGPGIMPVYDSSEISEQQLVDLIAYIQTSL
jgi:mono/diheme cytochrome c family protein